MDFLLKKYKCERLFTSVLIKHYNYDDEDNCTKINFASNFVFVLRLLETIIRSGYALASSLSKI